jgi:uncharacterized protein (TIGR03067 family)
MVRHAIGLAFLAVVVVLPTVAARQDAPEDEKLYGTWRVTSLETMGKVEEAKEGRDASIVFSKGGKAVMKETGKPDEIGSWKVSTSKNPKEIDIIGPKQEGKKQEFMKGVYDVQGDTLKIAISSEGPEGNRPAKIDPKEAVIVTLKRQKN